MQLPVDDCFEMIVAGKCLAGEALAFQRLPASFDVVEFGGVFGRPFRREPVAAPGEAEAMPVIRRAGPACRRGSGAAPRLLR